MVVKSVEFIDSQKLTDAANGIGEYCKAYNQLVKDIVGSTNTLLSDWHGEGRREFEKDYSHIYQQLTDMSDIMYELYKSLVDAAATYVKTDEEVAKKFTMEG